MDNNADMEIVQKENEINIRYDHLYKSISILIIKNHFLKYSNNNR